MHDIIDFTVLTKIPPVFLGKNALGKKILVVDFSIVGDSAGIGEDILNNKELFNLNKGGFIFPFHLNLSFRLIFVMQ